MTSKFEVCESCPITNKDDCLIVFGSKECAKILVSGIIKDRRTETKRILEMLFNLSGHTHEAISRFKDNQTTQEKAIENMNKELKLIQELLENYFIILNFN